MILFWFACVSAKIDDSSVIDVEEPPFDTVQQSLMHLDAFGQIASENEGNRTTGSTGYLASVEYVEEQLSLFGYEVTRQEFFVPTFSINAPPELSLNNDVVVDAASFIPLTYSPAGSGSGVLVGIDLQLPPGQPNSSTSGCQSQDFVDFEEGAIALIQRGSCTFYEKAKNAQNAGARAVIIFNEGQQGRRGIVDGTLGASDLEIPVLGTSYEMGIQLLESEGFLLQFLVDTELKNVSSYNILAEYGEGEDILMVGAHLDSVPDGPGINDNASGSASILAVAQAFAHDQVDTSSRIRFAFWGAEELGLLGSYHYTELLESEEVEDIIAYINFDMVGSPNFIRMVYDGDGSESSMSGPPGSDIIEDVFKDVLRENDFSFTETVFDGRSDYAGFISLGIPAGGLFSGAEGIMSSTQADNFEGLSGESYDPCYHMNCDTRENVDSEGFASMVMVTQEVILRLGENGLTNTASFVPVSIPQEHDLEHHAGGCHQNFQ